MKKIFLEFIEDYNGLHLKNFHRVEPKLEIAFLAQFWTFFENFITSKKLLKFTSSKDDSDVSVTADIICQRKTFQNFSKIHLEYAKCEN